MSTSERGVVVAVCGAPGAGKTTVATAVARRLGMLLLTRDEFANGLRLSGVAAESVRGRAEALFVEAAGRLARDGLSFVVESSVLSRALIDGLLAGAARVLMVHAVARDEVIGRRLGERVRRGRPGEDEIRDGDLRLLELFARGEMRESIFAPPPGAHAVLRIDTSEGGEPDVGAVLELIRKQAGPG
jgi:predicted kinase